MKAVEYIIFDLGGVVLQIDYLKTIDAFKKCGIDDFEKRYTQALQVQLFDKFETGEINSNEFHRQIQSWGVDAHPEQINACWNKMLLDLPAENINTLEELSTEYKLILLSNTNAIHVRAFKELIKEKIGWNRFKNCFEAIYFSNEIGLRKPHTEIFEYVLRDANMNVSKTIFFDDSPQHIEGAANAGIKGILYPQNAPLSSVLPGILAQFN